MKIAIVNTKGGVGKTTTAVGLANAIYDKEKDVCLIDTDSRNQSMGWSDIAEFEFLTIQQISTQIHKNIKKIKTKNIVLDTSSGGRLGVIISALKAANIIIVPIQPALADVYSLNETLNLVEDVVAVTDAKVFILLSRVVKNTIALRETKKLLKKQNLTVLDNYIPQSQRSALSFGKENINNDIYKNILTEITEKSKKIKKD
jgi:chromosome partitioning protein